MPEPLPGGVALTEIDPEFRADPHTRLKRLRDEAPVHRDDFFGAYW